MPDWTVTPLCAVSPKRLQDGLFGLFAKAYNAAVPDHVRYEYDQDIVPHLPLAPAVALALALPKVPAALLSVADLGYGQVGRLAYIRPDHSLVPDQPGLDGQRVQALTRSLATTAGLVHVVNCHAVDPPNAGYFMAQYAD